MALAVTLLTLLAACTTSVSGKGTGGTTGGLPCPASCATSDSICGAVGCDDAGACVYPAAGTSCSGTSCSGSTLTQNACDGAGGCQPAKTGMPCPGNYACGIDGSCGTSCNATAYCASGFVCNTGRCVQPIGIGACTENDDCTSQICGASGTGNCCREACATGDATCGSTGCDDGGACVFPGQTVVCGPPQSCMGSTQTNASHCDDLGGCSGHTTNCSPYGCGPETCKTTCTSNADCSSGAFCDAASATCCTGLGAGGTVLVDSVLGDDVVACCGFANAKSCRTLAHATTLVEAGPVAEVTLQVTVNGAAFGDWAPEGEVYPILLGWRAELSAPGIFFKGASDAGELDPKVGAIFELRADAGGSESASIVGTASNPVRLGMDPQGDQLDADAAILVDQGSTLYLANVSVNGNWTEHNDAIYASGTLILGKDRSGAVIGTVRIGNDLANPDTDGYVGIECDGCTLSDAPLNGTGALIITGQRLCGIDAEGLASIALSAAPVLGVAPTAVGFDKCPSKADENGICVDGGVVMSLDHATVQCMSGSGILMTGYDAGLPSVSINDTTIQNTQLALGVFGGSAVVSNSTVRYNSSGVEQGNDDLGLAGTVDLSGGAVGGRNTVACSGSEGGFPFDAVSVLNVTGAPLNASNVDWDTAGPDLFSCGFDLADCICQIATCTADPGSPGMDAVMQSTGIIVTNGNGLSPLSCAQ